MNEQVSHGILAANISYAVGLASSLLIFSWVFGATRRSVLAETRYACGGKKILNFNQSIIHGSSWCPS